MNAYVLALLLLPSSAFAQTRTTGDAAVTGAMGAGTLVPRAALQVGMQAADAYALKVSSVDASSLLLLDRSGKLGLGVSPSSARLDLSGSADAGQVALELRAGNSTASVSSAQIAFGSESGAYRHNVRSRATGSQEERNSLDFYLWTSSDAAYALGSTFAMSLQSSATASQAGLHVSPSTETAGTQLVVSSGTVYAGGVILGYAVDAPCFASIKTDIAPLGAAERLAAVEDVKALQPVSFRYRGDETERVGLIYEETPERIKDGRGAIIVDERLMNLELMLQAMTTRAAELEAELARLERGRR